MDNEKINEEYEENKLDDIVLDKYDNKERIKKYAIIGGSVLILLIIVISAVKIISGSFAQPQDKLVEEPIETKEDDFESIPIVAEDSFPQEKPQQEDDEINQVIKEVLTKEQNLKKDIKEIEKPKETKPVQNKPKPKPIPKPKEEIKPQPKKEPKKSKTTIKKGNYFIQVGAFSKYPDKTFLNKIKKSGFDYVIKESTINGKNIKRVYIGPFSSKKDAKEALKKVKSAINKNAFIKRL